MFSMSKHCQVLFVLSLILLVPLQDLMAEDLDLKESSAKQVSMNGTSDGGAPIENPSVDSGPIYRPPLRGAPMGRIAGGTRGPDDATPFLCALVPEHIGLTTMPQPNLYWYISSPSPHPAVFTISEKGANRPIAETPLLEQDTAGLQSVSLSDLGISLQTGKTYLWFVALVPDDENRSKDILTRGGIRRVQESSALSRALQDPPEGQEAAVYARHGLWYDALNSLMMQSVTPENDPTVARHLDSLLRQANLAEIAWRP